MSLPTNFFIGRGGAASGVEFTSAITFDNGNQVGYLGPTSTSLLSYGSRSDLQDMNFGTTSDGIQFLDVPAAGQYSFTIRGASSILQAYHDAGQFSNNYGRGATFSGTLSIENGDIGKKLWIAVGQLPANLGNFVNEYNGSTAPNGNVFSGGGGGTFLAIGETLSTSVPIIVAGGGGSERASYSSNQNNLNASTNFSGDGNNGGIDNSSPNTGGTNGNGGNAFDTSDQGTAGSGFYTRADRNFGDANTWGGPPWYAHSAFAFVDGAVGARANAVGSSTIQPSGGFGGGGAGGWGGSSGGGGYSGGGGGTNSSNVGYGGGGGNFIDTSRATADANPLANRSGAGSLYLSYQG